MVLVIIIVVNIFIIFNINRESIIVNSFFNYDDIAAVKKAIPFEVFINFYIFKGVVLYLIIEFLNTFELIKFYIFNYFSEIVILRIRLCIFAYPYRNTISYSNNLVIYLNYLVLRFFSKDSD